MPVYWHDQSEIGLCKASSLPIPALPVQSPPSRSGQPTESVCLELYYHDYAQGSYAAEMEQAASLAEAKANRKQ